MSADWGNHYYRVTAETPAYLQAGIYGSNTYVGASQTFGNVYKRVTLRPGDEIHKLVGGTFVRHDGEWFVGRHRLNEKHLFEKTYGRPPDFCDWPEQALGEINESEASERVRPQPERFEASWVYEHGTAYGRSTDYVLTNG